MGKAIYMVGRKDPGAYVSSIHLNPGRVQACVCMFSNFCADDNAGEVKGEKKQEQVEDACRDRTWGR